LEANLAAIIKIQSKPDKNTCGAIILERISDTIGWKQDTGVTAHP